VVTPAAYRGWPWERSLLDADRPSEQDEHCWQQEGPVMRNFTERVLSLPEIREAVAEPTDAASSKLEITYRIHAGTVGQEFLDIETTLTLGMNATDVRAF
jgi:hypothetical protein